MNRIFILSFFLVTVIFWIAIHTGAKEYVVWGQILDAYSTQKKETIQKEAYFLAKINHGVRFPRVYLMYPVMKISEITGRAPNSIFNYVVFIILVLSILFLDKIFGYALISQNPIRAILPIIVFSIFMFMHGRMTFAFLSMLIFLRMGMLMDFRKAVSAVYSMYLFIALWFASVSSGAYLVLYSLFAVSFLSARHFNVRFDSRLSMIIFFGIFIMGFFLYFDMVYKVIEFYGGLRNLESVLSHGFGRYSLAVFGVALVVPYLFVQAKNLWKSDYFMYVCYTSILIGLLVSLLGISSIITIVPGLLIIMSRLFDRNSLRWSRVKRFI